MDILHRMYSNPNFALYLFTVITILVILFVIVLILAIKDAKKVKVIEEKIEEDNEKDLEFKNEKFKESIDEFAFEDTEPEKELSIEKESISLPTKEETYSSIQDYRLKDEEETFRFQPVDIPDEEESDEFKTAILDSFIDEEPLLAPIELPPISDNFDYTQPLEKTQVSEIKPNDVKKFTDFAPFKEEKRNVEPSVTKEVPREIPEIKENKEQPSSALPNSKLNQFSSVYVDAKGEKNIQDVLPKKVEPQVLPSKPKEEPNIADELPKFKNIPTPKPIKLGPLTKENINLPNTMGSLADIENETYDIK